MRPLPGGDALPASAPSSAKPRARTSSVDHVAAPSSHVPTTFVMKRVEDLESVAGLHGAGGRGKQRETSLGVQRLADALQAAFGPESTTETVTGESSDSTQDATLPSTSVSHAKATQSPQASPSNKSRRTLSSHVAPPPLTSPNIDAPSPMPTSATSSTPRSLSPQSLKLSTEESMPDEAASQAIASSGDEAEEDEDAETQQAASASFPQLVMPSIQMPKRRPFTTKGKAMGKLKVLVAGQSGIGKTSLIRSMVQLCEDIVHVDPPTPSYSTSHSPPPKSLSRPKAAARRISEVHASTKPYPHWWTDVDESSIRRRRKSSPDTILERNICFVDTPGVSQHSSDEETMGTIVNYVESLMYQTSSITTLEDSNALGVVSGSGGVLVDAVLYLLPPDQDITTDIEFMQRLSLLTNVIPVIGKSDTVSAQEVVSLKTSILARLQISVKPFFFGKSLDDALLAVQSLPILASSQSNSELQTEPSQYPFSTPTYPFAISSTPGSDNDIMDASLLMSPDYVPPLLPSELLPLITQVFDPESIAWLRHSAAKRFLAWRKAKRPRDAITPYPLQPPQSPTTASIGLQRTTNNASTASSIFSVASPSGVLVPRFGSPFYASNLQSPLFASSPSVANSEAAEQPGAFSLARYSNAAHGELPLSEMRIAKWAMDLQRSRRNERDRFEDLQRQDGATWLRERGDDEASRGAIVAPAGGPPRADWAVVRRGEDKGVCRAGTRYRSSTGLDSRDPLGLCNFGDGLKRRGTVLVKVLGGVSVLGAVVVTVVRALGGDGRVGLSGWGWVTGGNE